MCSLPTFVLSLYCYSTVVEHRTLFCNAMHLHKRPPCLSFKTPIVRIRARATTFNTANTACPQDLGADALVRASSQPRIVRGLHGRLRQGWTVGEGEENRTRCRCCNMTTTLLVRKLLEFALSCAIRCIERAKRLRDPFFGKLNLKASTLSEEMNSKRGSYSSLCGLALEQVGAISSKTRTHTHTHPPTPAHT